MKLLLAALGLCAIALLAWFAFDRDPELATDAASPPVSTDVATLGAAPQLEAPDAPREQESEPPPRAEVPRAAAHDASASEENWARLDVRVVSKETGANVPCHRVAAFEGTKSEGWKGRKGEGARAKPGESAETDAAGRATLFVVAGKQHKLRSLDAWDLDSAAPPLILPLTAGDVREVVLSVPTEPDLVFHGLVVTASDGRPLAGASVRLNGESADSRRSNAAGAFVVHARSWLENSIEVSAHGYLPREVELAAGHEHAGAARVVALSQAATLEVLVLARPGSPISANVVVTAPDDTAPADSIKSKRRWTQSTTKSGLARFERLPADLQLTVQVTSGAHERVLPAPVVLAAGAVQRIEVRLDLGARVRGVVVDESGVALPNTVVRLVRQSERDRAAQNSVGADLRVLTDTRGEFLFEGVAPGPWAASIDPTATHEGGARFVAPWTPLEVTGDSDVLDLRIVASRARQIRGVVLSVSGDPLIAYVTATDAMRGTELSVSTNARGEFRFAMLPPGAYQLEARAIRPGSVELARVTVEAGAQNVVLRLEAGASVLVKLNAPGRRVERLEVRAVDATDRELKFGSAWDANGAVAREAVLHAGKYTIEVRGPSGTVLAKRDVTVGAGREPVILEIDLAPPADAADEQR